MGYFDDLLFSFLSTLLILQIQYCGLSSAQRAYDRYNCSAGNYTANSIYQNNLNLLLSSLSSTDTSTMIKGCHNATVGRNLNTVYGSFQCRGDVPSQVCQGCIDRAAKQIIDRCSNAKQAYIWYDECMLRYSNESFFSILQENPTILIWNSKNVTDPDQLFDRVLVELINVLTRKAASRFSSDNGMTASGERLFTRSSDRKIYGLVQCSSDISSSSCNSCLQRLIFDKMRCCDRKEGGRVFGPNCIFRYEIYPFYISDDYESPALNKSKGKNSSKIAVIIVVPTIVTVLSIVTIWYYLRKRKATKQIDEDFYEIQGAESWQFDFSTIREATDNFVDANKLGRGGFGSVYKGTLSNGEEIAVKRLSRNSDQGDEEFKNEVILVVQLQHMNLARLLGFCLFGDERLLIYEFLQNASLDQFIFDPIKRKYLDWEKRYKIIGGTARGLLYLHEDSRLKIIHRDLKASNILLDANMIPKISDFGMARSFMVNQTQASTKRIVGTYGYMAPEYAMRGHFSVKSDVYSFGVLILEILSGKRNNTFDESEGVQDLLHNAWTNWKNGTALEILDPTLSEQYLRSEVMRCIHIALLCVQEDTADRPTMASIIHKLNSYSVILPLPSSPPGVFVHNKREPSARLDENRSMTINEAPITEVYPR